MTAAYVPLRPIDPSESHIAVAGDWHGNVRWAVAAVTAIGRMGIRSIFHLGDFGIWPSYDGTAYVNAVHEACIASGVTIYITPGNHEDYDQIDELPVLDDGLQWLTDSIAVIPRGHRWTMGGRSFVSLGGAASIDFEHRRPRHTWWMQEMITEDDLERVVSAGYADVMFAHDAPDIGVPNVMAILHVLEPRWSQRGLDYAAKGRAMMTRAWDAVQPDLFMHGHFHVSGVGTAYARGSNRGATFIALNLDGEPDNLMILDLTGADRADGYTSNGIGFRWVEEL